MQYSLELINTTIFSVVFSNLTENFCDFSFNFSEDCFLGHLLHSINFLVQAFCIFSIKFHFSKMRI